MPSATCSSPRPPPREPWPSSWTTPAPSCCTTWRSPTRCSRPARALRWSCTARMRRSSCRTWWRRTLGRPSRGSTPRGAAPRSSPGTCAPASLRAAFSWKVPKSFTRAPSLFGECLRASGSASPGRTWCCSRGTPTTGGGSGISTGPTTRPWRMPSAAASGSAQSRPSARASLRCSAAWRARGLRQRRRRGPRTGSPRASTAWCSCMCPTLTRRPRDGRARARGGYVGGAQG
mmetsp:Transcript_17470/g.58535  ORF Transcript_17470/g.58535 Transcript_17470/m.58535 type:complete len:232 (+) Transcript_17470:95-790(+)